MITPRTLSLSYAAGSVGALISSLAIWFSGAIGLSSHFRVSIHPPLTPEWIFPNIIWGALWGLLFCLPYMQKAYYLRGLVYSLAPSAIQLFVIYPIVENRGILGHGLGELTWAFVLAFNAIWGLVTAWWLRQSQ